MKTDNIWTAAFHDIGETICQTTGCKVSQVKKFNGIFIVHTEINPKEEYHQLFVTGDENSGVIAVNYIHGVKDDSVVQKIGSADLMDPESFRKIHKFIEEGKEKMK